MSEEALELLTEQLPLALSFAITAHSESPRRPDKALRRHDGRTPYYVHPLWGAMTVLQEPNLPFQVRILGAHVLAFHDVLEDTTAELPDWVRPLVKEGVEQMTFTDFAEERRLVWGKPEWIWLLKLYDKVSNLLDGWPWMRTKGEEYTTAYKAFTLELARRVREHFGELQILKIAEAICK
ncbi:MAG: hypothetical protein A2172_00435 [Candidatus Woykebacteria bacterium RBG_13_40_15]|uniref:HD domain-containing protein n=1 Tax=Candidatus Woykebacteria bacterium RBG_13_40_15 TaxID=1802593 RepID=A0A1G1WAG8_9BACT|nr:MAG: hypothetical protein A2172_00435 [Candidatus Woykebacteria bacterium RBG_13_40_15]